MTGFGDSLMCSRLVKRCFPDESGIHGYRSTESPAAERPTCRQLGSHLDCQLRGSVCPIRKVRA
jgi:hypothetical protein